MVALFLDKNQFWFVFRIKPFPPLSWAESNPYTFLYLITYKSTHLFLSKDPASVLAVYLLIISCVLQLIFIQILSIYSSIMCSSFTMINGSGLCQFYMLDATVLSNRLV